jgi:hypothetical protein
LLKKLFQEINENTQEVDWLLEKFNPIVKDVCFLLDISQRMGRIDKIVQASKTI